MMDVLFDILKQFAVSVEQITFVNASLQDDIFLKIIRIMKNLKFLKFEGSGCNKDQSKPVTEFLWPDIVQSINEISIKRVNGLLFHKLHMFDTLTTLEVDSYMIRDYEHFECFLLMQKKLKVLHLRNFHNGSLFQTEKLTNNIKFSLDVLSLDRVYWTDDENAMKFFKTQSSLKKLKLHLNFLVSINPNELLIHLFGNNLHLKTVFLSTCGFYQDIITGFSFFEGIVNPSVEYLELYLHSSQN